MLFIVNAVVVVVVVDFKDCDDDKSPVHKRKTEILLKTISEQVYLIIFKKLMESFITVTSRIICAYWDKHSGSSVLRRLLRIGGKTINKISKKNILNSLELLVKQAYSASLKNAGTFVYLYLKRQKHYG